MVLTPKQTSMRDTLPAARLYRPSLPQKRTSREEEVAVLTTDVSIRLLLASGRGAGGSPHGGEATAERSQGSFRLFGLVTTVLVGVIHLAGDFYLSLSLRRTHRCGRQQETEHTFVPVSAHASLRGFGFHISIATLLSERRCLMETA